MNITLKKLFFSVILLLLTTISFAQHTKSKKEKNDIIILHHKYYTSYFSKKEHIPILLTYTLTTSMLSCPEHLHRGNWFTGDPEFEDMTGEPNNYFNDYRHSGYDKGHNMSAADNACDAEGMRECFYFSNMTPQPHSFNAGVWEDLEKLERAAAIDLDTLIISVGSIGISAYIGEDSVVLPKYMWKVIYTKKLNHYEAFIFPDADNDDAPLGNYHTTLQAIEEQAHLKFSNGFAYLLN